MQPGSPHESYGKFEGPVGYGLLKPIRETGECQLFPFLPVARSGNCRK